MNSTAIDGMGGRRLRRLRREWLLPVGMAFLTACAAGDAGRDSGKPAIAPDPAEAPPARTVFYECEPDLAFVAQQQGEGIELFLPDRRLSLRRAPASTIALYGGEDGVAFSDLGKGARLEIAPDQSYSCVSDPARGVWEGARLRGVDFRATGNEPGWYLEIMDGETILFVADYGERRYRFPAPAPRVHQEAAMTIYETGGDGHRLTVTLRGERCQDTMSGALFDTRVSVRLDEKDYGGCGRTLD